MNASFVIHEASKIQAELEVSQTAVQKHKAWKCRTLDKKWTDVQRSQSRKKNSFSFQWKWQDSCRVAGIYRSAPLCSDAHNWRTHRSSPFNCHRLDHFSVVSIFIFQRRCSSQGCTFGHDNLAPRNETASHQAPSRDTKLANEHSSG